MGIGFTVFGLIFFIVGIVTGVMFRKMQAVISGEPRALFLSFTVIGIAFSAVGIGMLLSVKKAVKKRKALLEGGKYLTAKVIDVIRDNSIEVNGRPAMAFLCEYYDPLTKRPPFSAATPSSNHQTVRSSAKSSASMLIETNARTTRPTTSTSIRSLPKETFEEQNYEPLFPRDFSQEGAAFFVAFLALQRLCRYNTEQRHHRQPTSPQN